MDIIKRCQNCGYYPFCKDIPKANCEKWEKRKIKKLEELTNGQFKFKDIY